MHFIKYRVDIPRSKNMKEIMKAMIDRDLNMDDIAVMSKHSRGLVNGLFDGSIKDPAFEEAIKQALNSRLLKHLWTRSKIAI